MRHLATLAAALLIVGLSACAGGPSDGGAAVGDCCKKTAEIQAQMPKCCTGEAGDCCKAGKADPSKKADCCKKAEQLTATLPACCRKAAAGEAQACCTKK